MWGVVKLFGHQDLETIHGLRQGLQFEKSKMFRSDKKESIDQSHSRGQGSLLASGLGTSSISALSAGQKQERRSEHISMSRKRVISSSRKQPGFGILDKEQGDPTFAATTEHGPAEQNGNSLTAPDEDVRPFEDRIFSCIIVSPPGRAIHEFESVEELLEACRDAVKGHRSLYRKGSILHRDISENNLIITRKKQEGDPIGTLIDFHLAKQMESRPSGATHPTGTMEFMAIDVLECRPHTYRHDLQSLFYVFIWVIICHQELGRGLPNDSQLWAWTRGRYTDIASMKRAHMGETVFRRLLLEFPAVFEGLKSLAEELRDILFPYHGGWVFSLGHTVILTNYISR